MRTMVQQEDVSMHGVYLYRCAVGGEFHVVSQMGAILPVPFPWDATLQEHLTLLVATEGCFHLVC